MSEYMKKISEEKLKRKKLEQKVDSVRKELNNEKAFRRRLQSRINLLEENDEKERKILRKEKKDLKDYIQRSKKIRAELKDQKKLLEHEKLSFQKFKDQNKGISKDVNNLRSPAGSIRSLRAKVQALQGEKRNLAVKLLQVQSRLETFLTLHMPSRSESGLGTP